MDDRLSPIECQTSGHKSGRAVKLSQWDRGRPIDRPRRAAWLVAALSGGGGGVLVLLKRKHHDRRAATATGYGYGYGHDRPLLGGRGGFARVTAAAALVRGRQPSIQLSQPVPGTGRMVKVVPFKAYRPPPNMAASLAAPPYDVIDSDEARRMADGNEHSFLRVNKPEIDLPASISSYDLRVYERGARNLQEFIARGWLGKDEKPSYYIYAQRMGDHLQHGICGAVSVEEYATGVIKRHEKTQVKKENDRTRLTYTQNANVGPVFIMYKPKEALDEIVRRITTSTAPETSFVAADDGIEHMVWPISDEPTVTAIREAFESIRFSYIADGHHRSASAFRVGEMKIKEAIANGQNVRGDESFCFFLAVLYPADQLKILEYNRVVKDLNGLTEEEYLNKVREHFEVQPVAEGESPSPAKKGEVGMCLRGTWHRLTTRPDKAPSPAADPVAALDVQYLYSTVLAPVLGIGCPREDERIRYVGGTRGNAELERLVTGERAWGSVAFSMYPVSVDEVMAIADAEGLMPPKATWFAPKLRSGLIVRMYDDF